MTESEVAMTSTTKRPLAWSLDDRFGTTPLLDLIASGPRHGLPEWLSSIWVVIGKLAAPSGRAWMRWRRAEWAGSDRADALYRRLNAVTRMERMRRRRA